MTPLFTIITVTYNAASTLPSTLESIRRQTCRLFEHIIQDGASTDGTYDIARKCGIQETRVISRPDHGLYDAMNMALAEAQGDYVIFLNAGARFHTDDTLQKIADTIMDNNYPGIVYGQTDIVDITGKRLADRHLLAPEKLTLQSFAEGMVVCHQSFVALRRITPQFNCRYRYSADYDWCIQCLQHSHYNIYIDGTLTDYLSEGMTTSNRYSSLKERFFIMCRYYGKWPTIKRHLRFIPRFLKRRQIEKTFK